MTELPQDVIKFLRENAPPPFIQEGDLTITTAAKAWGISETSASAKLEAAVKDGKLIKELRRGKNGRDMFAYTVKTKKG